MQQLAVSILQWTYSHSGKEIQQVKREILDKDIVQRWRLTRVLSIQPSTDFIDLMGSIATKVGGVLGNDVEEGLSDEDVMGDEKFDGRFDWGS